MLARDVYGGSMADHQKDVVITYETLYELLRREKSREELQKLSSSFIGDVLTYLTEKQKTYEDALAKTDVFSLSERETVALQLMNIKKILKELYDRRERKLLDVALNKSRTNSDIIDTTNMLPTEQVFFNDTLHILSRFRKDVLQQLMDAKKPLILVEEPPAPVETKKTKYVKFLEHVDQIVGDEMELYGPFAQDDQAELPLTLADILIGQGSAQEVSEDTA